ncbi:MAG: PEP-CTERM sorting domain-containing protein [Gammaproteobacteria bacterium]|nr:PEP-CTERM sorting domain-containing protein [Gammaproteobacteria bacterium]
MNMKNSVASILVLGTLALGTAVDAQAVVATSTVDLSGNMSVTGFGLNDTDSNPLTFTADLSGLTGTVDLEALLDGNYSISTGGTLSFLGIPLLNNVPLTPIYSGYLSSTGLTPGNYNFAFGSSLPFDFNFGFDINYDGDTTQAVLSAVNALTGSSFVNTDGAGTLSVTGTFFQDGTSATLNFTESNLTWAGFHSLLAAVDGTLGNLDGALNGPFSADVTVVARSIPEPGMVLLLVTGLAGLAGHRRLARTSAC